MQGAQQYVTAFGTEAQEIGSNDRLNTNPHRRDLTEKNDFGDREV